MRELYWKFSSAVLSFAALMIVPHLTAQTQPALNLMPLPQSFQPGSGQLVINQAFSVAITSHDDARLERAVERFVRDLARQTGLPLKPQPADSSKALLVIAAERPSKEIPTLGEDESYELAIDSSRAKITAPTTRGAMHGLQTLLQLVRVTPNGFAAPALSIKDRPRFPWRGMLIDVSRHFIPLEVLQRNLDGMAAVKMNVLHWHLSDDQGFRVETKKFPKLHQMGSDGLYYTQDQIRDLIAYAADRGIRVVPEFDMPGHSTSWFVGYPELASAPGPYQIERRWGIFDPAMDPTRQETYEFLDGFVGEMAKLFPDEYFHIGGDEVNGKQWDANPKIRDYIRSQQLKGNHDLQAHFNQRLQNIVSKHGRTMLGWDEILHPDLPRETVVQSWRGQESLAQAAKQGYRGLLSYGYYLDLMWPAWRHYGVDPIAGAAANLNAEEQQRILGGEACMWAEYVSPENIDSRIWPRAAAVAERLWSPAQTRDVLSMYQRLDTISRRLKWLGMTHRSNPQIMLQRLAGSEDISPLRELAAVVEPVKDYTRQKLAPVPPTSATPLNRLVDSVPAESDVARAFAVWVNAAVAGTANPEVKAQIRKLLTAWRDNHSRLQPLLNQSFLLAEVAPISQDLSALGAVGLQALDLLERRESPTEAWRTQSLALVAQAKKPKAQLLLVIAPTVEKLIQARSGRVVAGSSP
jgi:hexosaminidase